MAVSSELPSDLGSSAAAVSHHEDLVSVASTTAILSNQAYSSTAVESFPLHHVQLVPGH